MRRACPLGPTAPKRCSAPMNLPQKAAPKSEEQKAPMNLPQKAAPKSEEQKAPMNLPQKAAPKKSEEQKAAVDSVRLSR